MLIIFYRASKVRSTEGLLIHCIGKLTLPYFYLVSTYLVSTIDSHIGCILVRQPVSSFALKKLVPPTHPRPSCVPEKARAGQREMTDRFLRLLATTKIRASRLHLPITQGRSTLSQRL